MNSPLSYTMNPAQLLSCKLKYIYYDQFCNVHYRRSITFKANKLDNAKFILALRVLKNSQLGAWIRMMLLISVLSEKNSVPISQYHFYQYYITYLHNSSLSSSILQDMRCTNKPLVLSIYFAITCACSANTLYIIFTL